ncbi:hypothetical protein [Photobacterium damselae]|uniref:hypothetical protein n=1 Tax=Photobacterium damselae TaxID=38293 RepID=UPI004067FCF9
MRSYDVAKKEAVFIALPLLVLFLIKILNGDFMSFLRLSDFSLATSIMYGQLLAKTLDVPDKNKQLGKFSTYQVYIFVASILSMSMYIGFQVIADVNLIFYVAQIVIFLIGIVFYIPMSALITDLSK